MGKGEAAGCPDMAGGFAVCRAVPCVHAGEARRIAANIAKLPQLIGLAPPRRCRGHQDHRAYRLNPKYVPAEHWPLSSSSGDINF
jgi:hypothetical protein